MDPPAEVGVDSLKRERHDLLLFRDFFTSSERCAEEVKILRGLGWREFMLADDIFTSDHKWAVSVCNAITGTGVDIAWSCTNGIRVQSADDELFTAMRRAGCYRVSFGFESGNDQILKSFGRGGKATIDQGKVAVRKARAAGIDTNGFFVLGFSPDTEESMRDTIEYARTLELNMLKFGITIGFPGTPMFKEYVREGMIKSFDWDDYHIYTEHPLFTHRHLTHETVVKFTKLAFRRAIFTNPRFIWRRLMRGIRTGGFFWDLCYSIRFALLPATSDTTESNLYYAKDRWRTYDFTTNKPQLMPYPKAASAKSRNIGNSATAATAVQGSA